MCRWLVYFGDRMVPANLLYYAEHALIKQSENSEVHTPGLKRNYNRNHRVNVHGSGLGYYPRVLDEDDTFGPDMFDYQDLRMDERPLIYTSSLAPAQDRNLRRMSESILTSLCFAHIRAAGAFFSPVHEFNCHPFRAGRYQFMHNGGIAKFDFIKRKLLENVPVKIYQRIKGSTDSEVIFSVFLSYLPNNGDYTQTYGPDVMKDCLIKTIAKIELLTGSLTRLENNDNKRDEPVSASKSSLNFAVSDGETVIVTRFRSGSEDGPSLYITHTNKYQVDAIHHDLRHKPTVQHRREKSIFNMKEKKVIRNADACKDSVIICSEPLDYDDRNWKLIPNNNIVVIHPKDRVSRRTFESHARKITGKIPLTVSYTSLTRDMLRKNIVRYPLKDSIASKEEIENLKFVNNKLTKQLSNSHVESMHSNYNKKNTRLVPITIAIGVCLGLLLQIRRS